MKPMLEYEPNGNHKKKVIEGLEECAYNGNCMKCHYGEEKQTLSCKKLLTDVLKLLKEQEAEIRQLKLALDIAKGTCKGIKVDGR